MWEKGRREEGWEPILGECSRSRVGFFFLEGELWSRCDVGMMELRSRRPAAVTQARFAYWYSLRCSPHHSVDTPALPACQWLTTPLFLTAAFYSSFMALMVLNNLYVSECTAPSVHVGRAREQLGQSGRITRFHPSLKAAGYLTSTRTLYSPQTFRVRFSKRSKASGVIKALREITLYLSVV